MTRRDTGFSLVEMAIVLLILGLMLGGLLMPLTTSREQGRRSDTQVQLAEVEQALLGFAMAQGRLPCPATPTSGGLEAPVGGGICTRQHGFIPAATLGLRGGVNADGLLVDAWNNPLRYSVTTANGSAFTRPGQMSATGMAALAPDLRMCAQAACTVPRLADNLPAVVLSMGGNWATFTSADEVENAGEAMAGVYRIAADNDFVSREFNDASFDDLIVWLSPNVLYAKMIAAGRLP